MSELPDHVPPASVPEPKESALGVVLRRRAGRFEVLLGLRSRRARFMPGNLAFPGGKLEEEDGGPGLSALARCASREVLEETGISVPPGEWLDAGERTTPPFFPVRFRTRFFVAEVPEATEAPVPPRPDEIETLGFEAPGRVLAAWARGGAAVPPPLVPILRRLAAEAPADAATAARLVAEINAAEDPLPRIEFVPGIWVLPVRTATLPPATHTNVWMPGGRRFALVDPGSADPAEQARLLAVARRRASEGASAAAVVLTHHHRDHVDGAAAAAAALGVPVLAHEDALQRLGRGLDGVERRALSDGERLDLDGAALEAVHTPGHAPGHVALLDRDRGALISGDLVSGLSTILIGVDGGDMDLYLESLRRASALRCRVVLPSHGPPLPAKALEAAVAHRLDREARVLGALGTAVRTVDELALAAYADTPEAPPFLRALQVRAHLARLERAGRARAADPGRDSWVRVE